MNITITPKNYNVALGIIASLLLVVVIMLVINSTKYNTTMRESANQTQTVPAVQPEVRNVMYNYRPNQYQIEMYDNYVLILDGQRVVGTLKYNTSLGKMLVRDNW